MSAYDPVVKIVFGCHLAGGQAAEAQEPAQPQIVPRAIDEDGDSPKVSCTWSTGTLLCRNTVLTVAHVGDADPVRGYRVFHRSWIPSRLAEPDHDPPVPANGVGVVERRTAHGVTKSGAMLLEDGLTLMRLASDFGPYAYPVLAGEGEWPTPGSYDVTGYGFMTRPLPVDSWNFVTAAQNTGEVRRFNGTGAWNVDYGGDVTGMVRDGLRELRPAYHRRTRSYTFPMPADSGSPVQTDGSPIHGTVVAGYWEADPLRSWRGFAYDVTNSLIRRWIDSVKARWCGPPSTLRIVPTQLD